MDEAAPRISRRERPVQLRRGSLQPRAAASSPRRTAAAVTPLSFPRSRWSPCCLPRSRARRGARGTRPSSRPSRPCRSPRPCTPPARRSSRSPYEPWWCKVSCPSRRSSPCAAWRASLGDCGALRARHGPQSLDAQLRRRVRGQERGGIGRKVAERVHDEQMLGAPVLPRHLCASPGDLLQRGGEP